MFEQLLAILDLETTGTNPTRERITEIGLITIDPDGHTESWSSLVNPQQSVPAFIEGLTGISNAMLADAPSFEDLAEELQARLAGRVLVAHNARFDYAFLKNEFRRLNISFQARVLCTVKLSRRLFPQERHHNLDAIMNRHGLDCARRHRALGDAEVVRDFLADLVRSQEPTALQDAIEHLLKDSSLPAGLDADALAALPDRPGVYFFYGDNEAVLYVGKSVNLRSRVRAHFSGDHRLNKDLRISQQIRRVDWIETAGELGALLQEARLIKQLMPIHNRQLRHKRALCALHWNPAETGSKPAVVRAGEIDFSRTEHLYGLFKSAREAQDFLRRLCDEQGLCRKTLGLEKGKGPCFAYQIKRCQGACVGEEALHDHQARLLVELEKLRVRTWPYPGPVAIRERNARTGREELHLLDRWCYLGSAESLDALAQLPAQGVAFDLDTYTILSRFLAQQRLDVIELPGWPVESAA
ncbi:3'-5' exonuclease family protein [Thermithiobacillus plumbiphilus]|uniref:Excinuclease cho n=1 Tax=Thermithiobacillus plumbiphilus TaxID=1729899 RepID=A0ABU9D7M1_9PROT